MRFDPFNQRTDGMFLSHRSIMLCRSSICYNKPRGVNSGIWQKYGDDSVIAAGHIKYTEFELLNRPRPLKT